MAYHPKYQIKKGDTLQLISERFGIEEATWTRYHNNMCRLDNVIRENIPQHLSEIYLLPALWDKVDDLNYMLSQKELSERKNTQKVDFGYQNALPIKTCPETIHYKVGIILYEAEIKNTINYEITMRWLGNDESKHFIELNKISKTYINEEEPDLMADELAVRASSALYPLELVFTREEGIVDINNLSEIQKRWKDVKQEIRDYYSGDILENI